VPRVYGLEVDLAGTMLIAEDRMSQPPVLYTVDPSTGITTRIGEVAQADDLGCFGLAYDRTPEELMYRASSTAPAVGSTLVLQAAAATPGTPVGQFVTAVNGAPLFALLALGLADGQCNFDLKAKVPPGLSGVQLTVQAFGRAVLTGRNSASNPLLLSFP